MASRLSGGRIDPSRLSGGAKNLNQRIKMNPDRVNRVGARVGLKNRLKVQNRGNLKNRIQGLKRPVAKMNQNNSKTQNQASMIKPKSKDKLDMDLDEYMSKSKSKLDQDLDNYMVQSSANSS